MYSGFLVVDQICVPCFLISHITQISDYFLVSYGGVEGIILPIVGQLKHRKADRLHS